MTKINWNYWGTGSGDDGLKLAEITGAQALGNRDLGAGQGG